MHTENLNKQKHSIWRLIIVMLLVYFFGVVGGMAVAPRIIGERPITPEIITRFQETPVPAATEARLETPSPSPHDKIPITHELIIFPPVSKVTPTVQVPGPTVTSTPSPTPTYYSLTIQVTNPYYGNVSMNPYNPNNLYPKDTTVTLMATAKPGHEFSGWRGYPSNPENSVTLAMNGNKVIQGGFSKMSFTLNLDPALQGGTISISPKLGSYEYGSTVTLEARPGSGYSFKSWSGDASGSQNPLTVTMDNNKKIGATFEKGQYTLTTKANPVGFIEVNPPGGHQDSGTKVTLTAKPSPDYRFVSWSGDVSGTASTITITMNSNKVITANFIRTYTLTTVVNPPGYGTITPSSGIYDDGTEVTLTAIPISNYEFMQWYGNVTGGDQITVNTIRITMSRDKTLGAYFQQIKYP